jgi:hypothetical protein
LEVFGDDFERAPKPLKYLDASMIYLEARHFENLRSLCELHFSALDPAAIVSLPRTLTSLSIESQTEAGVLTQGACEGLEALEKLCCCLHHFESVSGLKSFKYLETLKLYVENGHTAFEEELFSHITSTQLTKVKLSVSPPGAVWPVWLSQCQKFDSMRVLNCRIDSSCDQVVVPEFLKRLPPRLKSLTVPSPMLPLQEAAAKSIISSPEFVDCYHHFPTTLTHLRFDSSNGSMRISDECFSQLPKSLTYLALGAIYGLTDRFWELIPPNIRYFNLVIPPHLQTSSFSELHAKYLAKFKAR